MKFKNFLNEYHENIEGSIIYDIKDTIKFVEFVGKKCFKVRMQNDTYKVVEKKHTDRLCGPLDYYKIRFWLSAGFMDTMIVDVEMEEDTSDRITELSKYQTITNIEFHEVTKVNGPKHPYLQFLKKYFGNVVDNYTVTTKEIENDASSDTHMLQHTLTLKKGKDGIDIDTFFNKYA